MEQPREGLGAWQCRMAAWKEPQGSSVGGKDKWTGVEDAGVDWWDNLQGQLNMSI